MKEAKKLLLDKEVIDIENGKENVAEQNKEAEITEELGEKSASQLTKKPTAQPTNKKSKEDGKIKAALKDVKITDFAKLTRSKAAVKGDKNSI